VHWSRRLTRGTTVSDKPHIPRADGEPCVRNFKDAGSMLEMFERQGLNPEGWWIVEGHRGFIQKLSGEWHFQHPLQGWMKIG